METGYSKMEAMRPRTRSRNKEARLFCFLYALAIFNSWVMWNAQLHIICITRRRLRTATQLEFRILVLGEAFANVFEPPPRDSMPTIPSCAA